MLVIADARHPDGSTVGVAPRQVLREQVAALAGHGLVAYTGFELELRVFRESYADAAGRGWRGLTPATRGNVDYALVGLERLDLLTRRIRREMEQAGPVLESARGECAPGQYEAVFRYDEALATADAAAFYKTVVKQIAAQEDLAATFMPKYDEHEGSSLHVHASLRSLDGDPVLSGDGPHGTSPLLQRALAGQVALLPELTLLFAPTVNAFKRLRPGTFAPTRAASTAGILLAFRHGLENDLPLPAPVRGAPGPECPPLPAGLPEAADRFEVSEVARKGSATRWWTPWSPPPAPSGRRTRQVSEWERARGFERR